MRKSTAPARKSLSRAKSLGKMMVGVIKGSDRGYKAPQYAGEHSMKARAERRAARGWRQWAIDQGRGLRMVTYGRF